MEELRRLPHNIEAEQAVIGSMLYDPRCIPEVIELIKHDDFYQGIHQDIFTTIYSMFAQNMAIDPITVLGEMKNRGVYDEQSSRDYILRLLDITPTAAHARQYSELVRQQALLRRLDEAAAEISEQARTAGAQADSVLDAAEQNIFDIRQGRENRTLHALPEILLDVYKNIRELSASGGKLPGISCGIPDLDNMLGGLLNSNFILVASRPAMGKTSFLLGIGLHAARVSGKTVAFFSLEMSRDQLVMRLLSAESRVNSQTLLSGALSAEEWRRVGEASGTLSKLNYLFDDNPALSVGDMKAKCRRVQNLGLIIIDYLQLMRGTPGRRYDNRTTEVGDISRSLKIMAKELGVPVLCASQLSRENEKRGDKRPMLSDLRESGSIEQDADVVTFLYRDEYYDENTEDRGIAECIIAKNRHGSTGKVELHWTGELTSFTAIDRRYDG